MKKRKGYTQWFAFFSICTFALGVSLGLVWGTKQVDQNRRIFSAMIENILREHGQEISAVIAEERGREVQGFKVESWEATGYAPLDPNAVNGICYSGDPNITAAGEPVYPGITVAAGPDIPFGTWLWVEGFGWRRVDDRGGKVGNKQLDICFATRDEAVTFGRQKVIVVIPEWETE